MFKKKTIEELEEMTPKELGHLLLDFHGDAPSIIEYIERIIDLGADLEIQDSCGWTAIHYAAKLGLILEVELYIKKGAIKNSKTVHNTTSLHLAVRFEHIGIIRMLLAAQVSLDIRDCLGRIPWDYANADIRFQIPELNPNA